MVKKSGKKIKKKVPVNEGGALPKNIDLDGSKVGATAKFKGKPIIAKSAKKGGNGSVGGVIHVTAKPIHEPKIPAVPHAEKPNDEAPIWQKADDGVMEAFAADLVDKGEGKFTGWVKYDGKWHDLRTFKEMKDEDGILYISKEPINGVTLRVLI